MQIDHRRRVPAVRLWPQLCMLVAVALNGCAYETPLTVPLVPASGTVLRQGKGVAGVQVVLFPADPPALGQGEKTGRYYPHGETDSTGRFELSTFIPGDGAPIGNWTVTLVWPDERVPASTKSQLLAAGDQLPDRLRGRYAAPERSKFRVEIKQPSTILPPLTIESR